jgi:hypothetical protein
MRRRRRHEQQQQQHHHHHHHHHRVPANATPPEFESARPYDNNNNIDATHSDREPGTVYAAFTADGNTMYGDVGMLTRSMAPATSNYGKVSITEYGETSLAHKLDL